MFQIQLLSRLTCSILVSGPPYVIRSLSRFFSPSYTWILSATFDTLNPLKLDLLSKEQFIRLFQEFSLAKNQMHITKHDMICKRDIKYGEVFRRVR